MAHALAGHTACGTGVQSFNVPEREVIKTAFIRLVLSVKSYRVGNFLTTYFLYSFRVIEGIVNSGDSMVGGPGNVHRKFFFGLLKIEVITLRSFFQRRQYD